MFVTEILGVSKAWAVWVVAVTWQLAALALVAWLCEKVFRLRQPRARYALWWFVLVAPLLLAPGRIMLERRGSAVRVPAPEAVVRVVNLATPAVVPVADTRQLRAPVATPPEALAASWWGDFSLADGLAALWLLGCVCLGVRLVAGHVRVRRTIEHSQPVVNGTALSTLQELLAQADLRREVALRMSASVGAPVLYGLRRPTILLPSDWLDTISEVELRSLLAHEVAHIKRHDFLANFLQRLLEILLFFHPFAWLASRRIALAREELADAWALGNGMEADSYARSLTAAAERVRKPVGLASVGVVEGKSTLLRRVEAIVRGGSLTRMSLRATVVLLVLVAFTAASVAMVRIVSAEEKPKEARGAQVEVLPPDAALTPQELSSLLDAAGLSFERFAYEFAEDHALRFTFDEYVDGARLASGWYGEYSLDMRAGRNSVLLVVQEEDRKLGFWLNWKGGGTGTKHWDLEGYTSQTQGVLRGSELAPGKRVPVYVFATNREETGGIRGFSQSDAVEDIASQYDRVIVMLAEIVLPGEEEGRPGVEVSGEGESESTLSELSAEFFSTLPVELQERANEGEMLDAPEPLTAQQLRIAVEWVRAAGKIRPLPPPVQQAITSLGTEAIFSVAVRGNPPLIDVSLTDGHGTVFPMGFLREPELAFDDILGLLLTQRDLIAQLYASLHPEQVEQARPLAIPVVPGDAGGLAYESMTSVQREMMVELDRIRCQIARAGRSDQRPGKPEDYRLYLWHDRPTGLPQGEMDFGGGGYSVGVDEIDPSAAKKLDVELARLSQEMWQGLSPGMREKATAGIPYADLSADQQDIFLRISEMKLLYSGEGRGHLQSGQNTWRLMYEPEFETPWETRPALTYWLQSVAGSYSIDGKPWRME